MNSNSLILIFFFLFTTLSVKSQWSTTGNIGADSAKVTLGTLDNFDVKFITNNITRFRLTKDGFLGIGTNYPTRILDVSGQIRLRTGANLAYVLTSDADGTANWKKVAFNLTGTTLSLVNNNASIDLGTLFSAGTGLTLTGSIFSHAAHTGDVTGISALSVVKIQGKNISNAVPINGQVLKWNNSATQWEPSLDNNTTYSAGTGINVSGTTITNTSPDQTLLLNSGTSISVTGVYPNFTINNTSPNQAVSLTGSGATSVSGTYPNFIISSTDNNTTYQAGAGLNISGTSIINTAPDKTVSLIGTGATTITGTYPDFTINSIDNNTTYSAGTGINLNGTTIENTLPDQTVSITGAGATTITGTYPNFTINSTDNNTTYSAGTGINLNGTTIANTSPDQTVTLNSGAGISTSGTYPNFTVTNSAPDKTVSLTGSGATSITGTYPNFTIATTDHDNQSLSLNNDLLTISNGNSVNLANYLDNTDKQKLTINDNELTISNGNTVTLPSSTQGVGINVSHGVISNTAPDRIVGISSGSGILVSGTYPEFTITNTKPNQSVTLTGLGATTVTGTYPNFTINSTNTAYTATNGITLTGTTFTAQTTTALWNANKLQGKDISSVLPTNGQILKYNGTSWIPSADNNTVYTATNGITLNGTIFSAQTTTALWNANKLQGKNIATTAPITGQVLKYINGSWKPAADISSNYTAGNGILIDSENIIYNTNELQSINFDNATNTLNISGITGTGASALIPNHWTKTGVDISNNNMGNVGIGTTSPLDKLHVSGGNFRLDANSEIYFADNSQIRCYDDNHRILFRREEGKLEFREWGDIIFSSGSSYPDNEETAKMVLLANGNVGIGNTSPQDKLDVAGNVRINDNTLYLRTGDDKNHGLGWYGGSKTFAGVILDGPVLYGYSGGMLGIKRGSEKCVLRWDYEGKVAIGSTTPTEKLQIQDGCLKFSGTFADVIPSWTPIIKSKSGTAWCSYNNNGGFFSSIGLSNTGLYYMNESFDYPFQVSPAGYALLTVANEETALAIYSKNAHKTNFIVNGKGEIYARKVIVRLQGWGDFVFAHDYELSPLTNVENYIKENCHLPGIPSAEEIETNGLDMGEMNKLLMQKVEELTLYLIDQQKQIDELKKNK